MITLIRKELKTLFCTPAYLAIVSALNLIPAIALAVLLNASNTQMAYAGFENVISLMVLVFALVIPAVAILSVYRDKKIGSDEFVYSMPASRGAFLLSKLFSQIAFFALPTAVMAIYPIILKSLGIVNFLHAYSALALLFVFEIFIISLSVMVIEKSGRVVMSLIITYLAIVVSFILGLCSALVRFLPFGTGFDKVFGGILFELSIFKKVDTAVYELLDWTAFLFFILGAVVFMAIALVKIRRKALTALISTVLVACVGILPMLLPLSVRQIDINQSKLYTPSTSISNYLSEVDEEITVYLIDPYSNKQEYYNAIIRTIEACDNVTLKTVNSSEDKEIIERFGLQNESQSTLEYAVIVQGEKRWKLISAMDYICYYNSSMGYLTATELAYRYETCRSYLEQTYNYYDMLTDEQKELYKKSVQVVNSILNETLECLEFEGLFADAISYVTADIIPTVYFLSGHGEEGTSANPYDFKANGRLPENADMAIINSPSEDYSEDEIKVLIDYVENGGKLYIFSDLENYSMPNFMSLLSYYGLSVEGEPVSNEGKTIINASLNSSHEAFEDVSVNEVILKDANQINCAEGTKYTYSPMLSYKQAAEEGDDNEATECSVAVSVNEGGEKKITLFTGATTFNSVNGEIGEDELEYASSCVSAVMLWMFDEFEPDAPSNAPKAYQKSIYTADEGQITKIVVGFTVFTLAFALGISAYIISRGMRSKRASREEK